METILYRIFADVLHGNHKDTVSDVRSALNQGVLPLLILNQGMIAAMQEVGRLFEAGEYYVPEMLVSARAMQAGMSVLKPYISDQDAHPSGKVVLGTVSGDYHDIGKNLVKMMLEGSGFEVIDLGVDVNAKTFVSGVAMHQADILAMSALINSTMPHMRPVIEALEESGIRERVKVLVGGAPVSETFAHQIGADAYAPDASRAASTAKSLLALR
ncbi:MAG: cobalamin-binding protein [Anaerolineales bacterium]|nr:cobalamin-binding protein [Anaerolineae bacterium]PWB50952.1 MAG: cobalamin-binding protein [Anaerolineales bacterium]